MITGMPRIAIASRDFDGMIRLFRDQLGMPVVDVSQLTLQDLGANIGMCIPEGGSNIELMSPGIDEAPLSISLTRFLERRGDGLFAMMLEAPVPDEEAEELLSRGLNVLPLMEGAGGRDVHPNSTHGVLIRVYPVGSFEVPPGVSVQTSDAEDNPGLSGISRAIVAVKDVEHAAEVYGKKFALKIDAPKLDRKRGVRFSICRPPSGGIIELVSVEDSSQPFAASIQEFLDSHPEGMYALVLQAPDVRRAAEVLAARGLRVSVSADSDDAIELDPKSTFGARFRIEPA